MNATLRKLKADLILAEMRLFEECKNVYPVGCIVSFKKGRGTIEAEVLDHRIFHTPELWVKNIKTGKEYSIGVFGFEPVVVKAAPTSADTSAPI